MAIICPFCGKQVKNAGLNLHLRNSHLEKLEEIGYKKIKSMAKFAPKPEKPAEPTTNSTTPTIPMTIPEDKEIEAFYEKMSKTYGWKPTPAALAMINMFSKTVDVSNFVNEAIVNEGKRRGVTAAIIKTEGGESMSIMPTGDPDKEFKRLYELMALQNQSNQSYSANSPMVMMMQTMKDKVNSGMSMGQFGKEMMNMIFMMKMMEGL